MTSEQIPNQPATASTRKTQAIGGSDGTRLTNRSLYNVLCLSRQSVTQESLNKDVTSVISEPRFETHTTAVRHSGWAVIAEIAAFVAFALLSKYVMSFLFWRYAGPVSLVLTLVLLTLYMRAIGLRWSKMGLVPLPGWKPKLMVIPQMGLTLVAFAAVVALTTIAGPAIGLTFMTEFPASVENRWGDVAGNLPHYLLWLGIVWTAAAFGEEMFFRGYLVTRLQLVFPDGWLGSIFAIALSALIFGYGHFYYQGWRGAIVTCGIGLAFGMMFLLFKRNLWPLIMLHGVIDTLTFTAIYMEWK